MSNGRADEKQSRMLVYVRDAGADLPLKTQRRRLCGLAPHGLVTETTIWPPTFVRRNALLEMLKPGDRVITCRLSVIANSVPSLIALAQIFADKEACLQALDENVELPGDAAFLASLKTIGDFLNDVTRERHQKTKDVSALRHETDRNSVVLTNEQRGWLKEALRRPDADEAELAASLGIDPATFRRLLVREGLRERPVAADQPIYGSKIDLDNKEIKWLRRQLEEGLVPLTELAGRLGMTYPTFRVLLSRYDLQNVSPRRPGRRSSRPDLSPEELDWLHGQLLSGNASQMELRKTLGLHHAAFHKLLATHGLSGLLSQKHRRPRASRQSVENDRF